MKTDKKAKKNERGKNNLGLKDWECEREIGSKHWKIIEVNLSA